MPRPATGQTPIRNVRIPDHVWDRAKVAAAERGETLTAVIERALRAYVARHQRYPTGSKVRHPLVRPDEQAES